MLLPLGCSYCLCDFACVPYFLIYSDNVLAGDFLVRCLLYIFFPCLSRKVLQVFDLVWFRLSCDHGWIRSGSLNVR